MEFTRFSLHHFFMILLASHFASAKEEIANTTTPAAETDSSAGPSVPHTLSTVQSSVSWSSTTDSGDGALTGSTTDPGPGCLIDSELSLVAVASAGGLIVCLLISTLVLACQVCHLQRRVLLPRPSRSNVDLVSGTGYWGTDRPEAGGIVGPCGSDVMLEEVRVDRRMEELEETEGKEESEREGEFEEEEEGAGAKDMGVGGGGEMQMQSSYSRDSCQEEIPLDLENMPLVV